jgi:heavy metal sensor kinase
MLPRRLRTIRVKLALWYCGATALVLGAYALAIIAFFQHALVAELQHQLEDHLHFAENMLIRTDDGAITWRPDDPDRGLVIDCSVTVSGSDGAVLFQSPAKIVEPGTPWATLSGHAVIGGLPVRIEVAKPQTQTRGRLRQLSAVVLTGLPFALVATALVGYALARRALAPVASMVARARTISADRLSERLDVQNPHDELGRLAIVFNETFAKLERSFTELSRFTADASHELRTPLTAIRTAGEVGLRAATSEAEYRDVIGSMLDETRALSHLVDDLLFLSRGEAGTIARRRDTVDLVELVRDVMGLLGVLAEEKEQSLRLEVPSPVRVVTDRTLLRRALINVVDNAIRYSPRNGQIRITVARRDGDGIVEVADSGPGIPAADRQLIFERFHRVDAARSRRDGGSGLGLAIARWATESSGGRLELVVHDEPGTTFRFVVPASERHTSARSSET